MTAEHPPREIAPGVVLVDTGYVRPGLAASYLLEGGETAAVVETGTALSVPRILSALAARGIAREEVGYVVVTHVHLDHAGGAGALLRELPRAKLVVHPRGARHMVDPSKLLAGSAEVYGGMEALTRLYGEVVPAPAERVVEAPDGFRLDLGGRPLAFLDAPGHARHHFVVHDPTTRGFFTGDTFGLSYRELDGPNGPFLFPTTTPVQLDPPALHQSIERMLAERPERMYLTHFGMLEGDIGRCAAALRRALDEHVRLALAAPSGPPRREALREALAGQLLQGLAAHGFTGGRGQALSIFAVDLDLNAQGLEVWLDSRAMS
ncbi:MAG TPA: MBL fold metallo-hydrolase [Anaeromyxobacteraceae bacterium]|nr:MBL fold metallo-hydrolase [Anaeromyxobacteraceae bacterium]